MDIEINLGELQDLPLYPPRRRLWDFIPARLRVKIRKRFSYQHISPRERWEIESRVLRLGYSNYLLSSLVEPAFNNEGGTPKEEYQPKDGWN